MIIFIDIEFEDEGCLFLDDRLASIDLLDFIFYKPI